MIDITITPNSIEMEGHALMGKDGVDVVCAAVSALTCNLIASLEDLSHDTIDYHIKSGYTLIKWAELSDKGKLLVDSWFLGLAEINNQYNCIEFN